MNDDTTQVNLEGERLYRLARRTLDAAHLDAAINFHQQLGEITPAGDLERGFELATRIRELRNLIPQYKVTAEFSQPVN